MDFFGQLLSFIVGIISSWFFWYILLVTKPNVKVSPHIAYNPKDNYLRIKVSNNSRRQVVDISLQLIVAEKNSPVDNTAVFRAVFHNPVRPVLDSINAIEDAWSLPISTVFRVADAKTVIKLLSAQPDRRLMLTLSATDAISNSKVVKRMIYKPDDIHKGVFKPGRKSFEIFTKIDAEDLVED